MLQLVDVEVTVGAKVLLDVEHLNVSLGKVTAILGPNGAGKSTALKVLSGDLRPQRGTAALDGRALNEWEAAALARRRAVLAQTPTLSFDFRVHEVVALGRQPFAQTETRVHERDIVERALVIVGCADLAGRSYLTLSGGERQRVQFARALAQVMGPTGTATGQYLLLDEPTSAMDLKYQIECLEVAHDVARAGNGVAIILHDLALALEFADDAYLLCGGQCLSHGPVEHVLTPQNVARAFDLAPERLRFALPERLRPVPVSRHQAAE